MLCLSGTSSIQDTAGCQSLCGLQGRIFYYLLIMGWSLREHEVNLDFEQVIFRLLPKPCLEWQAFSIPLLLMSLATLIDVVVAELAGAHPCRLVLPAGTLPTISCKLSAVTAFRSRGRHRQCIILQKPVHLSRHCSSFDTPFVHVCFCS